MPVIPVNTPSASYDVTISSKLLRTLHPRLRKLNQDKPFRPFVITSPDIWALWSRPFLASFKEPPTVLFLPSGESHKRLASVESLAQQLATTGADRDSLLLAFGGGVLGDMTGFLAAIYMRGIRYVQVPTTLLAQVDSSIGGKTGVNLVAGKNLIGSFHHPQAVFADTDLLGTLPPAQLRAGLQESIKAGIIYDAKLFRYMEQNAETILSRDPKALAHVVAASVRVKADVVSKDEKESGLRMILNFGHTIGHAIEAATNYKQLLHGEAVGWGSIAALNVATRAQDHHRKRRRPHHANSSSATALCRHSKPPPPNLSPSPPATRKTAAALAPSSSPPLSAEPRSSATSPNPNSSAPPKPCSPSCVKRESLRVFK